jgi:hypothetical protein
MAAPEVAIRRLATRIRAPDPEAAFAAGRLAEAALRRIGPRLDAALEAGGLDPAALVALPRLALRLHVAGEVDPAELGAAWAEALARAILAALPASRAAAPGDALGEQPAHFATAWEAEARLLRALAAGEASPWWAAEYGVDPRAPDAAAALLLRWLARDPARAARRMAALLESAPGLAARLTARQAAELARHLELALREAAGLAAASGFLPAAEAAALAGLLAALPAPSRAALAELPAELRAPWLLAALLAHAPAGAALLPGLLPRLAALPEAALRDPALSPAVTPEPLRLRTPPPEDAAAPEPVEVWCGGLLLLIRPLARLRPAWLALGDALTARLMAIGLIALRRLADPLPAAARRAALERDRPLLALFAGAEPPEAPLEEIPLPAVLAAEAEAALAALLAAAPEGVAHAPGALRRAYGRDPFAADAATDALCRMLLRPGRLLREEAAATLAWPLDAADPALRRAGWDLDPGWVPWLGRRILFRYGAP